MFDFLRRTEARFAVDGATPLGAVSCDVCTSNCFALVFFAKDNRLLCYPLFVACDRPFEQTGRNPDGSLLPANPLPVSWSPLEFEPVKLVSGISGGEIAF